MANKVLVITVSLIIQLSVNTATFVDADIYGDSSILNNKNYIHIDGQIPAVQQSNVLVMESENSVVEDAYDAPNETPSSDSVLNINEPEPALEKQERIIDQNKPMIALTYDDGPSIYTIELLDFLKENNSAATFFVLGLQAEKNEEAIIQMIEDGNQIGNHTYNHKRLTTLNDEELYNQINKTDNLIYETAFYKPFVMRPPYGTTSDALVEKLQKPIIKWSIDTRDWETKNAESITKIILDNVKDGDIILMHDLYESSLEASKTVIPELIKRGYQLVTISEMSENSDVILKAGQSYYNMYK